MQGRFKMRKKRPKILFHSTQWTMNSKVRLKINSEKFRAFVFFFPSFTACNWSEWCFGNIDAIRWKREDQKGYTLLLEIEETHACLSNKKWIK